MLLLKDELFQQAQNIIHLYQKRGKQITFVESCTGGLLSALFTAIPGSSAVVERGYVVYSNEAKVEVLGVSQELLIQQGAVSEGVAEALVKGAWAKSPASVAVSITGIAGPGGGSTEKPVGLVYIGIGEKGRSVWVQKMLFQGSRHEIRVQSVSVALDLLGKIQEDESSLSTS